MIEGTLIASSNRGGYAIEHNYRTEEMGIMSGQRVEIWLGSQWIPGVVERSSKLYHIYDGIVMGLFRGYFFIAESGGMCGLCQGMKVRVQAA